MPDGQVVTLHEWLFITPGMLADESKGWMAGDIDHKTARKWRKRLKKAERQIRNAQRRGVVVRWRHRQAPHGKHRILAWREVKQRDLDLRQRLIRIAAVIK